MFQLSAYARDDTNGLLMLAVPGDAAGVDLKFRVTDGYVIVRCDRDFGNSR